MAVKVLMTWDVKPDLERDYFEFVIGEFIPGLQQIGLQPADAWATLYGEYPQIQVGVLAPDLETVQSIFNSAAWQTLRGRLLAYVENFAYKILPARRGFQF